MKIGLTYDLRDDYLREGYGQEETAEFDRPETITAIEEALQREGHRTDRIGHVKALVGRLAHGDRWDLVFNIAEGLAGVGREAQVPALLDAYGIPYTFSDPLTLALCLHKGLTKVVVRHHGLLTPDFAVVASEEEIDSIRLPFPLFVKPLAEGTGKGIHGASRVDGPVDLAAACRQVLASFRQPALVETYLPGREFTVGVTGTGAGAEVIGLMEIVFIEGDVADGIYSYSNKSDYERVVRYVLPEADMGRELARAALHAWRVLGCRDGGRVDLRLDAQGRPQFIEVNPLAGLNPVHSDLPIICRLKGIPYQELIRRILQSAAPRVGGAA